MSAQQLWTADYIGGINVLLKRLETDNKQISNNIQFYQTLLDVSFTYTNALKKLSQKQFCAGNPLDNMLKSEIDNHATAPSQLRERSYNAPLRQIIENLKQFQVDLYDFQQEATTLRKNHTQYTKALSAKSVPHPLKFPLKLGSNVYSQDELAKLLTIIAGVPLQSSRIPIPGMKQYFSAKDLLVVMKKTSVYEVERIGQGLLAHGLIVCHGLWGSFNVDGYYEFTQLFETYKTGFGEDLEDIMRVEYARMDLEVAIQKAYTKYDKLSMDLYKLCHNCTQEMRKIEKCDPIAPLVPQFDHEETTFYSPRVGSITCGVFGVDLVQLPRKMGDDLLTRSCPSFLYAYAARMSGEGWEKELDIQMVHNMRAKAVQKKFDHENDLLDYIFTEFQPVEHTMLFKQWLLELPDSVLPFSVYEQLKNADRETTTKVCGTIPRHNLAALLVCLQILRKVGVRNTTIPTYHLILRSLHVHKSGDYNHFAQLVPNLCESYDELCELLTDLEDTFDKKKALPQIRTPVPSRPSSTDFHSNEEFVPRKFKSSPIAASGGISNSGSQRRGLNLFKLDEVINQMDTEVKDICAD